MYLKTVLWIAFALFAIAALVDVTNGFLMGLGALFCLVLLAIIRRAERSKIVS